MVRRILSSVFFSAILLGFLLQRNTITADEIPSCTEVARNRSNPGASPPCAPKIIDNDTAFQALRNAEEFSYHWYVFMTERNWQSVSYKDRWNSLFLLVSAVQSLYDKNSDVFFVVTPVSDIEKGLLSLKQNPRNKIKAHARYMWPETMSLGEIGKSIPSGHKKRLYTLIVY